MELVDGIARLNAGRSRALVASRALESEGRHDLTARDAEILARTGPDSEFAGLAEYVVGLPAELA